MKPNNWIWQAVKTGAIGGAVVLLLSLVGMVMRFSERSILEGVIDLGRLVVLTIFFVAAYQAAPNQRPGNGWCAARWPVWSGRAWWRSFSSLANE
ncbi:MAG TPA: hypothetical protein PKE45_12090 [Caldilineaceae bacterium]|nr:hypothetical protein [Caldilineaceae bacterium]